MAPPSWRTIKDLTPRTRVASSCMRALLQLSYRASALCGALALVCICVIITIQVIFNTIDKLMFLLTGEAIGLTVPSYSEFSGLFLAAGTFLALGYTFRESAHILVTLLLQALPNQWRHRAEQLSLVVAIAMVGFLTWYLGVITWEAWIYHDVTSGIIPVPIWIPQLLMTLGSGVLSLALIDTLIWGPQAASDD